MDWEALAAIVAVLVAAGTAAVVVWRGGGMAQTQKQHGADIVELKARQQEHAGLHARMGERAAASDAKLDLILSQQERLIEKVDRLAEKEH